MEYIKLLKDYSKTPLELSMSDFLTQKCDSSICVEKITNKDFLIQYVKPINDFIVCTTAKACCNTNRMLY